MEETSYRDGSRVEKFGRKLKKSEKKAAIKKAVRQVDSGLEILVGEKVFDENPLSVNDQIFLKGAREYVDSKTLLLMKKVAVGAVAGASLLALGLGAYSGFNGEVLPQLLPYEYTRLRDVKLSLPDPPMKGKVTYTGEKNTNGEYVIKRHTQITKDSPPVIETSLGKVGYGNFYISTEIVNEGLNHLFIEYVALIDLDTEKIIEKQEMQTVEVFGDYSVYKNRFFVESVLDQTHKYVIEAKDHYHTVRSDPITIRVEEAK